MMFVAWATALLVAALSLQGAEHFVAPGNGPAGDGTAANPWDLQTALDHPLELAPGDTLWLLGGIYRVNNHVNRFSSSLSGAPGMPITVRAYPSHRAIIDGNIAHASGGWVIYRDFEISSSLPLRLSNQSGPFPTNWWISYDGVLKDYCVSGFDLAAPNVKLVNLIVHDCVGGGFGIGRGATNAEMSGCLAYYNGWQGTDRSHGHGVYAQNATTSTTVFRNNLIFENLALGIQGFGGVAPVAGNMLFDGNAIFLNGIMAWEHQGNFVVGANQGLETNVVMSSNMFYDIETATADVLIGCNGGLLGPVVAGNFFGTPVTFSTVNLSMTVTGNVFASGTVGINQSSYPLNSYGAGLPATNRVFVRRDPMEQGRAGIIVFNYERLDRVDVDISGVGLNPGDAFELHNAADYFNDIVSGVFSGPKISISMTNHSVATPVGRNFATPPSTFPVFGAFVIRKQSYPAGPPVIAVEPQNRTFATGTTGVLTVVAIGKTPAYQWFRDGAPLADDGHISGAQSPVLRIADASVADIANYNVLVSGADGCATSATARVEVMIPPAIASQPKSVVVLKGQTASFSVVGSGSTPLAYRWSLNNTNLPDATNSTLTVSNATPAAAGCYAAIVANGAGMAASAQATLSVRDTPAAALIASTDSGGRVHLVVEGISGFQYMVLGSSNLFTWTPLTTNISPFAFEYTNRAAAGSCFFKSALIK